MIERVTNDNLAEFEQFNLSHPKGHFLQSKDWAKVKSEWTWNAVISRQNGEIKGVMAFLTRKVPHTPFNIMYSARGPVCDIHDEETIAELIDGAKKLAREKHAYVIKMDPDVLKSDTHFAEILTANGLVNKSSGKNFEGIQPQFVFRLNIENKTADEILAAFHQKTRYNLRLAERKGVIVRIAGRDELPEFARIMKDTGLRDGFVTRPQSYFERLLDALGENARLYMAYHENTPIAGTLAVHYGDKVWYLYGASANEYRNFMPNYLLQWKMIEWAVEKKCRIYDFRGVSGDISEDNPLYGLYKFKKGFGGDFCEFVGEFEYVVNPAVHFALEKGMSFYRGLRRKIYLLKNRGK